MHVRDLDRQASPAGGFLVHPGASASRDRAEALLALADGSIWHGWSASSATAVAGEVKLVGDVAHVGDQGRLTGLCCASFDAHLLDARAARTASGMRGFLSAAGATTPLHATVALAVARGEIGRP